MHENILEGIGLTKGEVKVYLSLLETGETTIGRIVEKSGLSSGKIYEILDKLMKKGLVTIMVKEKTKFFNAASPRKLLNFLDEKERFLNLKKREVEKILPYLINLKESKEQEYSAVLYKGTEGLKTAIYETLEQLSENDEWLVFGASKKTDSVMRLWLRFNKERMKKKISAKHLTADYYIYEKLKHIKYLEFRYLKYIGLASMSVSKNIFMIYNWEDISVIKITNDHIARSFRDFFYSLWNVAKPIGRKK